MSGGLSPVVVDCTATDGTVPALLFALEQTRKIVLANKKPLTVQQEVYDERIRAGVTTGANGWIEHAGRQPVVQHCP